MQLIGMLKRYGLIGFPLSHSFSPTYFNEKFSQFHISATYEAYPLDNVEKFVDLCKKINFSGLNVTIPYKKAIIPFLDEIDPIAQHVGAINTIQFHQDKKIGYNTDIIGFEKSLLDLIGSPSHIDGALVLGSGGASQAVTYILNKFDIPFIIVSTSLATGIRYHEINKSVLEKNHLIINTTPLGMYPLVETKPDLPYGLLDKNYFLYDLVYNPINSLFLTLGSKMGCRTKNGSDMLIHQAEEAWRIWNLPEM